MAEWAHASTSNLAPEGNACEYWVELDGAEHGPTEARWAGLAGNQAAPEEILLALVATESRLTRLVLANRRELPPSIARQLAAVAITTGDPGLATALATQQHLETDDVWALVESGFPEVLFPLAFLPEPPDGLLERLAAHPDPSTRWAVASRPGLSRPLAELLARDPDVEVRCALQGIVDDPPAYLAAIQIRDPDPRVRATFAPYLDPELLPLAVADSHPQVRGAATQHEQITDALLDRLAADGSAEVRLGAAWSQWSATYPAGRPRWQLRLAEDPDPQVRLVLTRRLGRGDDALLTRLAEDPDPAVRGAAKARLGLHPTDRPTDEWSPYDNKMNLFEGLHDKRQLSLTELEWLAVHERVGHYLFRPEAFARASAELLRQCAQSEHALLRRAVAHVAALPEDLARQLAADPDPTIPHTWGLYGSTSPDVLRLLAAGPQPIVEALLANPHTPADVLAGLPGTARRIAADPLTPTGTLAGLATDPDDATRLAVAGNPGSPGEVLARMAATEADPAILRAVCGHPSLPVAAMRDMLRSAG
ncbi:hypothetical protein Cs7R123_07890 [Catellatospora sp. TT07R-123]|uniref:hypothetical protein n=1 Tax=Catellatospora sp. TT07R-123 TaxID=2733863 RepID=UPI001B19A650|nr:hypothetical protein [Catellatospora sp. TT07R-123]GHJ43447.1 hypothetical protein Cs7R123_07890 [Catellatospora sp. TT07R-123]